MSNTYVNVTITLTVDDYSNIARLLEQDYPRETSVQGYLQSCAEDLSRDAAETVS